MTKNKGLIVIGYQGIGKSTHAGNDNCIDLESSNFYVLGKRDDNWFIPYCHIAIHLANQGYTVFVSSHKEIRDYLRTAYLPDNVGNVCVFCPATFMKEDWIAKLEDRYSQTKLTKDYRAMMNAKERYTENILELMNSGFPVYQPSSMDYDLKSYISKMRNDWC